MATDMQKMPRCIMGYPTEELVMFAHLCNAQSVSPKDMIDLCKDVEKVYAMVTDYIRYNCRFPTNDVCSPEDFVFEGGKFKYRGDIFDV